MVSLKAGAIRHQPAYFDKKAPWIDRGQTLLCGNCHDLRSVRIEHLRIPSHQQRVHVGIADRQQRTGEVVRAPYFKNLSLQIKPSSRSLQSNLALFVLRTIEVWIHKDGDSANVRERLF